MKRKIKGGYQIVSHTGKNLGKFKTEKEANARLRAIEYFKHKGKKK